MAPTKFEKLRKGFCSVCKKRLGWKTDKGAVYLQPCYMVNDKIYCSNCYMKEFYLSKEK